jgi:hypothetical protein
MEQSRFNFNVVSLATACIAFAMPSLPSINHSKTRSMNPFSTVILGLSAWVLAGCASPPVLQAAKPERPTTVQYSVAQSQQLKQTNHLTQHVNAEKNIVYFQNQGGGGVGLGLLLGPLGVAANMSMIESVTKADAAQIQDKIHVNPEAVFQQAAQATGFSLSAPGSASDAQITPYLFITKTDDASLHLASCVIVESKAGEKSWTGRYLYQLPSQHSLASLAAMDTSKTDSLRAEAVEGFGKLLQHISAETAASTVKEPKITFKSGFLTPRFVFEQAGSLINVQDNMVWVRGVSGVYAVQKAQITYAPEKN